MASCGGAICFQRRMMSVEDDDDDNKKEEEGGSLGLEGLVDHVQVQMMSYLPLEDARSIMTMNSRYRSLLLSQDAKNLWKEWCACWPQLKKKKNVSVVDDLGLPIAAASKNNNDIADWHQQANLSLLLSMAKPQPTEVDQEKLQEYRRVQPQTTLDMWGGSLDYVFSPAHQQWMVEFTGTVGPSDRCVRSNLPLPRPTLIDWGEWIVPPTSHCQLLSKYRRTHALPEVFCRGSPRKSAWRPFVAPFMLESDSTKNTVHLTPRFVSYFEVSIVECTATNNNNQQQNNNDDDDDIDFWEASRDCVCIGVAMDDNFNWHGSMPGWDDESFGYHGDDGGIYHDSGESLQQFGPTFGRGDVVGCGIDHTVRGIFFTLNGKFLGYAWTGLPMELMEEDLYPVVGIDTRDWVHCNFGTEPFQYDLKSLVVRHEELVHQSLALAVPKPEYDDSSDAESSSSESYSQLIDYDDDGMSIFS